MALSRVFKRNTDLRQREVLGETLLVPIRGELVELQRIFALNPVARHIWDHLDGQHDLSAVCAGVVAVFDVEPAQAEADLLEFADQLSAAGLIVEAV